MKITMDSRQRVLRSLSFQPVDRVPFDLMEGAVWPGLLAYFRQEHAIDDPAGVIEVLDPDFRWTFLAYLGPQPAEQDTPAAPTGKAGYTKPVVTAKRVTHEQMRFYWSHLASDLAQLSTPRVVLAFGGLALTRLAVDADIQSLHGSVSRYYVRDLPVRDMPTHREQDLLVCCLHPAGFMRTKLQAERMSCERVIARAARYALGRRPWPEPFGVGGDWHTYATHVNDPGYVEFLLAGAERVVIDTEFDPGGPAWGMQFTIDGKRAWLARAPMQESAGRGESVRGACRFGVGGSLRHRAAGGAQDG